MLKQIFRFAALLLCQVGHAGEEYRLSHRTTYDYDRPVSLSEQIVRLVPRTSLGPAITNFSMKLIPPSATWKLEALSDGNTHAKVTVAEKVTRFSYVLSFTFNPSKAIPVSKWPLIAPADEHLRVTGGSRLRAFAQEAVRKSDDQKTIAVKVCRKVNSSIEYGERHEPGVLEPEVTLARGRAACRDMTLLLMHSLRSLGMPTRFVSGYLVSPGQAGKSELSFHAWCEAYIPQKGWIGLDATSGREVSAYHIPLYHHAEPEGAAGLSGEVEECVATLTFDMTAEPFGNQAETQSPTKR